MSAATQEPSVLFWGGGGGHRAVVPSRRHKRGLMPLWPADRLRMRRLLRRGMNAALSLPSGPNELYEIGSYAQGPLESYSSILGGHLILRDP